MNYVGGAVRSGLEQGYQPVEVIAVDDGSTDDTPALLRQFGSAIRSVRLDGRGVSAARNAGLAEARGDYIIFLDADDLLLPGGVSAQVAELQRRPEVDAVAGEWYVCDVESRTVRRERTTMQEDDALPRLLRSNAFSTPSAMMLRRSALEAVGGFDTRFAFTADWEMWLRLAKRGRRFSGVPVAVVMYRVHARSMTRNIAQAIPDTMAFLDHCFDDATLPASARALEPRMRYEVMMYLARLGLTQGDDKWARECVQRALRSNPAALDTFAFYDALIYALSQERKPQPQVDDARRIYALIRRVDDPTNEPASRRALRYLAAGMMARSRGEWKAGVRSLWTAARASWRTVLQRPQRAWVLRLMVRPGVVNGLRALLTPLRLRRHPHADVPPLLRAILDAEPPGKS